MHGPCLQSFQSKGRQFWHNRAGLDQVSDALPGQWTEEDAVAAVEYPCGRPATVVLLDVTTAAIAWPAGGITDMINLPTHSVRLGYTVAWLARRGSAAAPPQCRVLSTAVPGH